MIPGKTIRGIRNLPEVTLPPRGAAGAAAAQPSNVRPTGGGGLVYVGNPDFGFLEGNHDRWDLTPFPNPLPGGTRDPDLPGDFGRWVANRDGYQMGWNEDGAYVRRDPRLGGNYVVDFEEGLARLDPNASDFAEQAYALLTRAQWQDYIKRFAPIEAELAEAIQEGPGKDVGSVRENVEQAFSSEAGQMERRLGRMGVQVSDDQRAAMERQRELSRAATMANEVNRHIASVENRRLGLLSGTSSATATVKNPNED